MGKTLRSKWGLMALAAALLVGLAMIPAVGLHSADDDTLRLHMGDDGAYFQYEWSVTEGTDTLSGSETQTLSSDNKCLLTLSGDRLVAMDGSDQGAGLVKNSIGIKSNGPQAAGVPCSRIGADEDLTIDLVGVPAGLAAEFDFELKGDTHLKIFLGDDSVPYEVKSGSLVSGDPVVAGTDPYTIELNSATRVANCKDLSDSGPDAGPRDNCRIVIDPNDTFDSIRLVGVAGEASLEGGGDFGTVDPKYDTVIYLEPWDGILDCGDSTGPYPNGGTSVDITRYQNIDDPSTQADESAVSCTPKAFTLDAVDAETGDDTVTFELSDPSQVALYRADLTFDRPLAGLFDAQLFYDPDGSDGYDNFVEMPACTGDPGPKNATTQNASVIPGTDQGCIVSVLQLHDGTTTWDVLFYGDWRFK